MAWQSSSTPPLDNKTLNEFDVLYSPNTSQDTPLDPTPLIMFTILHTLYTHILATYLVQCEEGFILQGFQVDLEQTGQVLRPKNPEGQWQGIKQQYKSLSLNLPAL